ncbi:uncharacterized protein [Rutidosis leptorrhynchoides]|uniref:uncharacterized protein n=1 Tax=Rutidosis leptorrhynchoides TaxID=125765 RepID=UPI003A98DA74
MEKSLAVKSDLHVAAFILMSVFMLPCAIIKEIEALMRGFLWCQGEMKRGKAKVKWARVCLPKDEGGLGLKRLKEWNVALMSSLIWRLLTNKQSLWVRWIHAYHLNGRNFWEAAEVATAMWHDNWCEFSPLSTVLIARIIFRAGLSHNTTISDIVNASGWLWPEDWITRFPGLTHIPCPILVGRPDTLKWRNTTGNLVDFSVSNVWESLLMGENLRTQDKLRGWDLRSGSDGVVCPLCNIEPDSHEHLFFGCTYASQVWLFAKKCMMVPVVGNFWTDFVSAMSPYMACRTAGSISSRLLFAATVYFIWQERNFRLFKKESRSCGKLVTVIFATIRLKLMSLNWKNSQQVKIMKDAWKIP